LLLAIAYSVAHWGLASAIYWGVAHAFAANFTDSDINFPGAMLLLALTLVGSVLNLPGLGGGAQYASFIGLTNIFGVDVEPAMAMAVVLWIITFAGSALVGIPLLIHEGLSMGELRKLARAEAQAEEVGAHIALNGANGNNGAMAVKGRERGESPQ
jgi:glycosyltransferase 2 family protein